MNFDAVLLQNLFVCIFIYCFNKVNYFPFPLCVKQPKLLLTICKKGSDVWFFQQKFIKISICFIRLSKASIIFFLSFQKKHSSFKKFSLKSVITPFLFLIKYFKILFASIVWETILISWTFDKKAMHELNS